MLTALGMVLGFCFICHHKSSKSEDIPKAWRLGGRLLMFLQDGMRHIPLLISEVYFFFRGKEGEKEAQTMPTSTTTQPG